MFRLILEFLLPLIITLYLIIDVFIPAFSKKKFFWFAKSFGAEKEGFEDEISTAEKSFEIAKEKMEELQKSATKESEHTKEHLKMAEEILKRAKENLEKFKEKKKK